MQTSFDAHALGAITNAARNPITGKIAIGTTAGIVFQYDIDRDAIDSRALTDLKGKPVNTVAWSPNGIFLASANRQGYVGVWQAATAKGVLIGQVDKTNCYALSWSRGGAFLVIPCVGKQELVVYPASEFTLGKYLEDGRILQLGKADSIFKWKGGKSNLAIGNFSPDDLHFVFTGGDTSVQVVNTAKWELEKKVKVPVRPTLMHWVANDRLIVSGPPEKLDKDAEKTQDLLLLVEMPSGKLLASQPTPTIYLLRMAEEWGLAFLLQDLEGCDRLGFRVIDTNTLQTVGEVTPKVPDICDIVFLPHRKQNCVVTRSGLIVGDWNGKEGSHYNQVFTLQHPSAQSPSLTLAPTSTVRAGENPEEISKEPLFAVEKIDLTSVVAISADGTRRVVIPGLDPDVAKKWASKFKRDKFLIARTSLSDLGLSGEFLQLAAVLKALEGAFDIKDAINLFTGGKGRLAQDDAYKFLYFLFKRGIIVMA